ncbi:MAG: hypothetical protein ABIO83_07120, partial [Ilumatobacteraceae bacterium]
RARRGLAALGRPGHAVDRPRTASRPARATHLSRSGHVPMISGTRHLASVLTWKPLAATAVVTAMWLALVEHPSALLLSIAGAAVAAATPFVLDDTAAPTLRSSPATLLRRRAHRVAFIVPMLASWWIVASITVSRTTAQFPLTAHALQFATLIGIGLAGAAITSQFDRHSARGGTTGALAVIICFGTSFLPARPLQLIPGDPGAPGAARQLMVVFAVALAIQLGGSADPAQRATL